jgi:hypothetical protein
MVYFKLFTTHSVLWCVHKKVKCLLCAIGVSKNLHCKTSKWNNARNLRGPCYPKQWCHSHPDLSSPITSGTFLQRLSSKVEQLRWSRGSMLAFSTQVHGFKHGRSRRIFKGEKILSTPSFGVEVKLSVPCHRFMACKRTLECIAEVGISRQNYWLSFSLLGALVSCKTQRDIWRQKWEQLEYYIKRAQ